MKICRCTPHLLKTVSLADNVAAEELGERLEKEVKQYSKVS